MTTRNVVPYAKTPAECASDAYNEAYDNGEDLETPGIHKDCIASLELPRSDLGLYVFRDGSSVELNAFGCEAHARKHTLSILADAVLSLYEYSLREGECFVCVGAEEQDHKSPVDMLSAITAKLDKPVRLKVPTLKSIAKAAAKIEESVKAKKLAETADRFAEAARDMLATGAFERQGLKNLIDALP